MCFTSPFHPPSLSAAALPSSLRCHCTFVDLLPPRPSSLCCRSAGRCSAAPVHVVAPSHSRRCCSVIDGKAAAQNIISEIAEEVRALSQNYGKVPLYRKRCI
nr:uncharacterized protein LOC112800806 [Arachis hypogaea]